MYALFIFLYLPKIFICRPFFCFGMWMLWEINRLEGDFFYLHRLNPARMCVRHTQLFNLRIFSIIRDTFKWQIDRSLVEWTRPNFFPSHHALAFFQFNSYLFIDVSVCVDGGDKRNLCIYLLLLYFFAHSKNTTSHRKWDLI